MMNYCKKYSGPNLGCMVGTAYQVLLGKLSEALHDEGLDVTPAEYMVLRSLYSDDSRQLCEITEILGKDKAAVSRCVSSMVTKGLVFTRTISHKCRKVYLSEQGRSIETQIMNVGRRRHEALVEILSEEELATFTQTLEKIIYNTYNT